MLLLQELARTQNNIALSVIAVHCELLTYLCKKEKSYVCEANSKNIICIIHFFLFFYATKSSVMKMEKRSQRSIIQGRDT